MENTDDKYYLGVDEHLVKVLVFGKKIPERYKVIIFELLNVACDIQVNKCLTTKHLSKLEEGFRQSWEEVWFECSGRYIARLAHNFFESEELLEKLWNDKNVKIRVKVVSLIRVMPIRLAEQIMISALQDKSKVVRGIAAFEICTPRYMNYLPLVHEYLETETDTKTKNWIISRVELLKNKS